MQAMSAKIRFIFAPRQTEMCQAYLSRLRRPELPLCKVNGHEARSKLVEPARIRDVLQAVAISLPLPITVLTTGDPLFFGLWYYLIIPIVIIGTGMLMRAPPPYLTGASLAVAAAFLVYMMVNYTATRPEGLLGLGHLFSLPGGMIGHLLGVVLSKRQTGAIPVLAFGVLGWGIGFFVNNLVICNTLMYCGPLSLRALL
jgi:hypothetical protein